jgi:predicted transposase YbfD/YdcC
LKKQKRGFIMVITKLPETSTLLMFHNTAQHSLVQGGKIINLRRRARKHTKALVDQLRKVKDERKARGKRYQLWQILGLLLLGISAGCCNIKEILEWTEKKWNRKLIKKFLGLEVLPHATTVSRAISKCEVEQLVDVGINWFKILGTNNGITAASMDGKTMRGVHGEDVVNHILTLFTHQIGIPLAQVGVASKENEITAIPRLLEQINYELINLVLTGDALLTQKSVIEKALSYRAHYLLTVKDNHQTLKETLVDNFADQSMKRQVSKGQDYKHGRYVDITVEISNDLDLDDLDR